MMMEGVADNRM